ncbi:hypothetical protein F4775DRAFT_550650 [Biscogniauxia sp. FL1348]|nr:hypothetical protein F4775DRAFT_550650 [Biscogniauxia sp. FL1348]
MKLSFFSILASALGASAAGQLNYTDSNTGISFSGYTDGKGYTFGMALPEDPAKDFIAQIVAPITDGAGWAGIDMGVSMAEYLLIVAWPNGDEIMLSPRLASAYATPSVYTGDVTLSPIAKGTFVNSTHYSATFVCGGCITGGSDSFSTDSDLAVMAYAYSTSAVTDPTDTSTALSYHSAGFSGFGQNLAAAKSVQYATWAAMATNTTTTPEVPTTGGGNSTIPSTNQTTTISNSTYDYIIVGAGPAGVIAASRLAESGASVLLIERGGASTFSTGGKDVVSWNSSVTIYDVPALAYYLSSMADSSTYCTDTASQAGCILGGGSMVNALMFVKPQDADFNDKWPVGWKASDIRSASERLFARNPGTSLPSADDRRYDQGAYDVLSKFLGANGFRSVDALNEPNSKTNVFSHPPWNIHNHERGGPVKTYLPLVQNMANFKLSLNTKVVRTVRNGTWVSGVEVEKQDGSHEIIQVTANSGKVLLAAGALSTPRILFYSGIGPSSQIRKVPASVKLPASSQWIDLPVGEGLQDHPIITLNLATNASLDTLDASAFTSPSNSSVSQWGRGSGLLTQGGQRLNFWTSVTPSADGQKRFLQGTCNSPSAGTVRVKLYLTHGLTSSSSVVLDSTGANTQFSGSPWLQTRGDIEAYEMFLERVVRMAGQQGSGVSLQLSDGSAAPADISGAALLADLNSTLVTGAHYVGTARMGARGNGTSGGGVVDTDTRVYGTDNLFVVDASMHPDLPTGNTQAIVMVAAEKAVERILALDGVTIPGGGGNNGTTTSGRGGDVGGRRQTLRPLRRGPGYNNYYGHSLGRRTGS